MKKLLIVLMFFGSSNIWAGQTIYKCVVKGKIVYSNNEKDKDWQHTDITEVSKMTVLNKKFPEEKKEVVQQEGKNFSNDNRQKQNEALINKRLLEQKKQIDDGFNNITKGYLEGLEKAIKSSGG